MLLRLPRVNDDASDPSPSGSSLDEPDPDPDQRTWAAEAARR
ncbi:MAG: hypothetical protein OXG81_12985 [Acidobacteria bacterium]|nr:hypothetical protein [Acidobacteriota bacterium]